MNFVKMDDIYAGFKLKNQKLFYKEKLLVGKEGSYLGSYFAEYPIAYNALSSKLRN